MPCDNKDNCHARRQIKICIGNLDPDLFFFQCARFVVYLYVETKSLKQHSSVGPGFLKPSSQLRRTDATAFCMHLKNPLVR